jgi:hypothetical protein
MRFHADELVERQPRDDALEKRLGLQQLAELLRLDLCTSVQESVRIPQESLWRLSDIARRSGILRARW